MVQYLILVWSVHTYILRRAVVGNLVVEHGQLRNLDEIAETLFGDHFVGHRKLELRCFLREYRGPRIEAGNVLPLQLFGTQIFEEQIQLRQGVGDGRSRKERRSEIAPRALLNGADGV